MELLTEDLRKALPPLGSDPERPLQAMIVQTRFFDPCGGWNWYPIEFDGSDVFFGIVASSSLAFAGQFTLRELEALSDPEDPNRLVTRRDESFTPVDLAELIRREPRLAQIFSTSGLRLVGLEDAT